MVLVFHKPHTRTATHESICFYPNPSSFCLLSISCPLCFLAAGPNPDRAHLLFHGLFALLKGPVTPRQSASGLFNSCDRCHNRPLQPNEQMCVIWPRYCSCVCSYNMCDVHTARRKKETGGQMEDLLLKQWLFRHYLTQLLCSDCHASVWHHLLTTVAKIKVWKLLFFSDFSESTCLPKRPIAYDSGMGLFTQLCSQLHVFNRKTGNSTHRCKEKSRREQNRHSHMLFAQVLLSRVADIFTKVCFFVVQSSIEKD